MRRWIMGSIFSCLAVSLSAAEWYVGAGGTDALGFGTAPGAPFQTIQYAITQAAESDVVNLAAGTFQEHGLMVAKSLTIRGAGRTATVVDAEFSDVAFFLYGVNKTIVIEDLAIMNGYGRDGGGVMCLAASATLRRCDIVNNYSDYAGGGVRNQYGTLRVTQCNLAENAAWWVGGAAYNCDLDSSLLVYNIATNAGGAANCTLRNCTVVTNVATTVGGLLNCTAYNTIAYGNGSIEKANEERNYRDTTFRDSLSWPLPEGAGNIDDIPLFVMDWADWHEFITSPCINRGNPDYVIGSFDLDGNNRQFDGLPDMGATEFTLFSVPARIPVLSGSTNFGTVQVPFAAARTLYVFNKGNATLTVTDFVEPAGFTASMADPTVEPGQSNAVQVVFAPPAGGSYRGLLQVESDKTWGESTILIFGSATPAPSISVSPDSLSVTANAGFSPAPASIDVRNAGSGSLAFTLSADQLWISFASPSAVSEGDPVPMQATFNTAALIAGTYAATVTVSSAGAVNSPVRVPVSLTVLPEPLIEVSALSLSAAVPAGANATSQVFRVRNGSTGTRAFTVSADFGNWESLVPEGAGWFSVSPASASSSGEWVPVTVSFDAAGLPNGDYQGVVRIAAEGAGGSSLEVAVHLTVGTAFIAGSVDPANWHVAPGGNDDTGDGSLATPFATIARAISAASDGQIIQLAAGVYNQSGMAIRKNLTIRGAGWTSTIIQPRFLVEQEWEGRLFFVDGVTVAARFENLWIRNGQAHAGAAILAVGSTVDVYRCRLSGHAATLDGGGAVRNLGGQVTLTSCILDRNQSVTEGGAVFGCALSNSLVVFNTADSGGGAVNSDLRFCTVAQNKGGGVKNGNILDSIVMFNEGGNLDESTAALTLSDPLPDGEGNLTGDPFFEACTNGDFHLDLVSPALNSEASAAGLPALDLFGRPRVVGLLPDLGPLEKQYVVPVRRIRLAGNLAFGNVFSGTSATQALWVINTGNTNLNVTAISTPSGFSAVPAAVTVPALGSNRIEVVFAPLSAGTFGGTVQVVSDAVNNPVSLACSGTGVLPPPSLVVAPLVINVECVEGQNASNESFTVANGAVGSMSFSVASDSSWMTPIPASGSSTGVPATVTLSFNTDSLLYGDYEGKLTVAASGASNSPMTVVVNLTVFPGVIPDQPEVLSPIDDVQVLMTNAIPFQWTRAARSDSYQVWIGANGSFFTNGWTGSESETNLTITAPFRLGSYTWMVAGWNWLGFGPWSSTGTFTVVRDVSPSGGIILPTGTTPLFTWTETPGVTQFQLEVQKKDKATGTSSFYVGRNGTSPAGFWSAPAIFPKGSYRWRLRESVGGDVSDWDPWYYFQIGVPATPQTVTPKGTTTLWRNVRFKWKSVTSATAYQLEITTGGNTYYQGPWQAGLTADVRLLSTPATYKWRVRARNDSGAGAWSAFVKVVRVDPAPPINLYPDGLPLSTDSAITFQWDAVSGATRYELGLWLGSTRIATYKLTGMESRTYTATAPFAPGFYTWQVRAGSDSWGAWSEAATFTVQ